MQHIGILTALLCFAVGVLSSPSNNPEWEDFKVKYRKQYGVHEEEKRRSVWEENRKLIIDHNKRADQGFVSFRLGINQYSDITREEFLANMHGYHGNQQKFDARPVVRRDDINVNDLPTEVNWKDKGWVTSVGNQLQCGSCWAFTALGAVEGQHFNRTGKLVQLSAQNLMDCSQKEGNNGCEGGMMVDSYEYIMKNNGVDTEKSYPYVGKEQPCKFNKSNIGATVKSYVKLPPGDEKQLQIAVATVGPISVAVDGELPSFGMYKSGIYDEPKCSSQRVDHSLLAVGYGVLDGKKFWLLKNSWGTSWGMEGYIMMSRDKHNQCGIANMGSYPIE